MKKPLIVLFLFLSQTVLAQIPEPEKNTYINDFAHVLTTDRISELNGQIAGIEKSTGVQVAIVLVNEIPAAYEIEDYALLIGRKWHVGNNKNGIVYVASISQHKQRLQIATGLYQTLTKDKRDDILEQVKPYFKQEDYAGGINALVSQLSADLGANVQTADASAAQAQNGQPVAGQDDDNLNFFVGLGFVIVIVVVIAYFVRRRARARRMMMYNNMGGGFGGGAMYPNQGGPGVGTFVAGAAAGALAGYAAEKLMENGLNNNAANQNNGVNNNQPQQTNPSDYGNWGAGSTFDDSSSSDDSGFSSDSSDDDSGSSSDW